MGHAAGATVPAWNQAFGTFIRKISVQVDSKHLEPAACWCIEFRVCSLFFSTAVSVYCPATSIIGFINALV
jgi:hypothetical protein